MCHQLIFLKPWERARSMSRPQAGRSRTLLSGRGLAPLSAFATAAWRIYAGRNDDFCDPFWAVVPEMRSYQGSAIRDPSMHDHHKFRDLRQLLLWSGNVKDLFISTSSTWWHPRLWYRRARRKRPFLGPKDFEDVGLYVLMCFDVFSVFTCH